MNHNYKQKVSIVLASFGGFRLCSKEADIEIVSDGKTVVFVPETNEGWHYDNIRDFFKRWTIIKRRILIEKKGHYL